MTSSDDFHLLSWPNAFAFLCVLAGALLPIFVRRYWRKEIDEIQGTAPATSMQMVEEPQTRELSTLSTVIFEATDFDLDGEDTPIGSLGLIGVGRTPVTAEFWPERRLSLLLPRRDSGTIPKDWGYEYAVRPSFEYVNMVSVSATTS